MIWLVVVMLVEMPALPGSFEQRQENQERVEQAERWRARQEERGWQDESRAHQAEMRRRLDELERDEDDE